MKILKAPEAGRSPAQSARSLVVERYTWESAVRMMDQSYQRLLDH